jgi:co-chaperonin GroES (HSP10)
MAAVKGKLRPLHDKVMVTDMNFGEGKTKSGIVLTSDDGKSSGLHPRWCRVIFVGNDQKDIKVGQWLMMQHGRWTRGIKYEQDDGEEITIHMIDLEGVLLISDEKPDDGDERVKIGAMNFNIPGA